MFQLNIVVCCALKQCHNCSLQVRVMLSKWLHAVLPHLGVVYLGGSKKLSCHHLTFTFLHHTIHSPMIATCIVVLCSSLLYNMSCHSQGHQGRCMLFRVCGFCPGSFPSPKTCRLDESGGMAEYYCELCHSKLCFNIILMNAMSFCVILWLRIYYVTYNLIQNHTGCNVRSC